MLKFILTTIAVLASLGASAEICEIVMENNRLPAKLALRIDQGNGLESVRGTFTLAKNGGLEHLGYSILKSKNGLTVVAGVHDGGAEDGKPRMVDQPVLMIGIGDTSCVNPQVIWPN